VHYFGCFCFQSAEHVGCFYLAFNCSWQWCLETSVIIIIIIIIIILNWQFLTCHDMENQNPLKGHELSMHCEIQIWLVMEVTVKLSFIWLWKTPATADSWCLVAAGSMLLERSQQRIITRNSLMFKGRWGHPAMTIAVCFCHWLKKQADRTQ